MEYSLTGISLNGFADVLNRPVVLSQLVSNKASKVQTSREIRIDLENFGVDLLSFCQSPSSMVSQSLFELSFNI